MQLCELCFAWALQPIHLNGLLCLLKTQVKGPFSIFENAAHRETTSAVWFPVWETALRSPVLGSAIRINGTSTHLLSGSAFFLCGWLRLREQVISRTAVNLNFVLGTQVVFLTRAEFCHNSLIQLSLSRTRKHHASSPALPSPIWSWIQICLP